MTASFAPSPPRTRLKGSSGKATLGRSVRLVLPGHSIGDRPKPSLPAIAVLGRSNVGKSSLLNALLGTKVARVSQTPGRTQALYWYRVDDLFDLVDCPGYGFAKISRESRALFQDLIEDLLTGEPRAVGAILLVDGRLEPREADRSMALFLTEANVPTVVAATKWDAVKPSERVRRLRALAGEYERPGRSLLPVSSETGENLHELVRLTRSLSSPRAASEPHPLPSAKETPHAS